MMHPQHRSPAFGTPRFASGPGAAPAMFTRLDTSVVSNWRWTTDWVLVTAMMVLVVFGFILILAAGPSAARRISVDTMHFVNRQILFILAAIVLMMATSLLSLKWLRRVGALGFLGVLGLLAVVPVLGSEIKGSTRWISLGSFALQPSEFAKPLFVIVCAWLFAAGKDYKRFPGEMLALGLLAVLGGMLIAQPDFGMTMIVSAVFGVQYFLAGLSLFWVFCLVAAGCVGAYLAYLLIPHVHHRVNAFLDPASTDQYQITQSMRAFTEGGFLGRGPGEGRIKSLLPDAHTDFIFSVAGEEFGMFLCLLIAGLFLFIALRATWRLRTERDLFAILATGGLIALISFQALINMASSLSLIPTKGMTLPFISYGGSSTLATALAMGMLLALSRHRTHGDSP